MQGKTEKIFKIIAPIRHQVEAGLTDVRVKMPVISASVKVSRSR